LRGENRTANAAFSNPRRWPCSDGPTGCEPFVVDGSSTSHLSGRRQHRTRGRRERDLRVDRSESAWTRAGLLDRRDHPANPDAHGFTFATIRSGRSRPACCPRLPKSFKVPNDFKLGPVSKEMLNDACKRWRAAYQDGDLRNLSLAASCVSWGEPLPGGRLHLLQFPS